jgi:hypothetical protein
MFFCEFKPKIYDVGEISQMRDESLLLEQTKSGYAGPLRGLWISAVPLDTT